MAKSKDINEKIKQEKRSLILKEALKHFAAKGLFATKIKDIAEGAGIAQGLVYNYFGSKEDIYIELINNALDKINAAARGLASMDLPAREKIRVGIAQILKTIEQSDEFNQTCRFISQATTSSAIPEEAKRSIAVKRDQPYRLIGNIIAEGQKEGTIVEGDPYELAVLFWTTINGLAIYKASREERPPIPKADLLIKMFLK
ncbi:MAG: TetR/AcrR family transcriptional regulator [Bacillota bacterium]